MKEQGISDGEIISELSQSGVSLREISEALRQAQIKHAVSDTESDEEMMPSIMPEDGVPSPNGFNGGPVYTPRAYEQQEQYPQEQYYQQQEQYPQEQYYQPEGNEQYAPTGVDTNTVMEVADQVFSDRIKKTQKQVDNLTESATLLQAKMENVSERLKKMEAIMDKLQIAILEKVGSYGRNLESIKKEMSMVEDSFSKMISPSRKTERQREEQREETEEETEPKRKVSRKK